MKFIIFCIYLATVALRAAAAPSVNLGAVRYDNYSVYKVSINSTAQLAALSYAKRMLDRYDIWKEYDEVSREVHIMVNPEAQPKFCTLMRVYNIAAELMIPNVQQLIDEEVQTLAKTADDGSFGWTRYHKLDEIESWLDTILATYPEVTTAFTIGRSYEERDIRGIKISYKAGNPGIFIESNIHAREWITSATVTWFINQLLTSEEASVRDLAENYDWYIVPVFNVDGFAYSHDKDRLWRKTRQPVSTSKCIGTDANRNFDSHWMENGGASSNPCDETFAGPTPFSEPEAQALADYVASIRDKINIYLSFHSYGQYLLSPYGHSKTEFPENYEDLMSIGWAFTSAISGLPYKTQYTLGSTASVLYVASGSSVDWVFNTQGIKVAYTIEYRDVGRYGFVLPPVQILPNCEELMAGMLALVNKSKALGYI